MILVNLPVPPLKAELPQNDANPDGRHSTLIKIQERYVLNAINEVPVDYMDPNQKMDMNIPLLKTPVPAEEAFDDVYTIGRGVNTVPMVKNQKIVEKITKAPFSPFSKLADYESLYIELESPDVVKNWMSDHLFAEQRLSGANPGVIQKMFKVGNQHNIPSTLDVAQLEKKLGASIDELIGANLYFVDHTQTLAHVSNGAITIPIPNNPITLEKYLPKSIALFTWDKDAGEDKDSDYNGRLVPLAIQVDKNETQFEVLVPEDDKGSGLLWTIAKILFSITDANAHEMYTHLGSHHFALEAFGAVTARQLSAQHPLHLLLKPHLRFLLWNNQQGMERLVQPSGPVDILLAGTLRSSLQTSINAADNWSIKNTFDEDMKRRNVGAESDLPHYPFRDDGRLIWSAIESFVAEYLAIYYQSPCDIENDYELQSWAAELSSTEDNGGHIKDMPNKISCLEELVDIVTMIIFANSAGHSAINFTQYPYMGFSPNMPLAGYASHHDFLQSQDGTVAQQLDFVIRLLPPQFVATLQISITNALSIYHYDQLGEYETAFESALANQSVYEFNQNLQNIERRIQNRNQRRFVAYPYLLPSEILNSASI